MCFEIKTFGIKEIGILDKNIKMWIVLWNFLTESKWKLLGLKEIGTLDKNKKKIEYFLWNFMFFEMKTFGTKTNWDIR